MKIVNLQKWTLIKVCDGKICVKKERNMKKQKIFRNVKFHHEDSGNCKDVFYCDDFSDGRRFYNRRTDGVWYTTYPSKGYYESSDKVKENVIFNILDKAGNVIFVEGNGLEPTFKPFDEYVGDKTLEFSKRHNLMSIDDYAKYMTDLPEYESFGGYKDNWLYAPQYNEKISDEEYLEEFFYLGICFIIYKKEYYHTIAKKSYTAYFVKSSDFHERYYCDYTIGYKF